MLFEEYFQTRVQIPATEYSANSTFARQSPRAGSKRFSSSAESARTTTPAPAIAPGTRNGLGSVPELRRSVAESPPPVRGPRRESLERVGETQRLAPGTRGGDSEVARKLFK